MELSTKHLNHLEKLPSFEALDTVTKTVVIKHFFDFKSDFNTMKKEFVDKDTLEIEEVRTILCRKCDNGRLVDQTTKGMIEHYLAHTLDNLSKLGLYNKRPILLYLGG